MVPAKSDSPPVRAGLVENRVVTVRARLDSVWAAPYNETA